MFLTVTTENIKYKSNRNKNKNLSLKEYPDMIKPYLSDIINNHKKWEIQLTMPISFISFKVWKKHVLCNNIKIMMGSETNDILEELFESLQKYQKRLVKLMRESEFVFDGVNLLYYHLYKISLKRGGSFD